MCKFSNLDSGPLKAADSMLPDQPPEPDINKAENNDDKQLNEIVNKEFNVEKSSAEHVEVDEQQTADKEEVFGSLVSLTEFNPNPNSKQDQ